MRIAHLTLALAVCILPVLAAASDDGDTTSGHVVVGAWDSELEGSPDLVSEYEAEDGGPTLGLLLASHQQWGSLLLSAHASHTTDREGALEFDIGRVIRSETDYSKLLHRLGHDPMSNLEATSINGKVVFHTDLEPSHDYQLRYEVVNHRTELQLPSIPALTLAFGYRNQTREGHRQAYLLSHCDTCHIVSRGHRLEERTTDGTMEAEVAWRGGSLKAALTSRTHRQGYPYLMHVYDDALHPELQVPVFDNRLQYDSAEGALMADLWPDSKKDTVRLDLHLSNLAGFVVNGGAVWSETENRVTGLQSDYSGYAVNAARRFDNGLRLRWRGRIYAIDNDDVWVDTNERVSYAGPHAGRTYEDIYGVNYDWLRQSALNRHVFESRLDLSYRLARKLGTVKLHWDLESVSRDHYMVLPGEYDTTTHELGLSWRARPAKGWRLNASLRHAMVDNPFMLIDGACSTLESPGYTVPWDPATPQYDDQHQTRIAETTASPSSWSEARFGLSYTAGKTTVSGSYRWWDGDNDDGDLTDWSRTSHTATLTVWSAPAEHWEWYAAATLQRSELDAPMCIPIFDG